MASDYDEDFYFDVKGSTYADASLGAKTAVKVKFIFFKVLQRYVSYPDDVQEPFMLPEIRELETTSVMHILTCGPFIHQEPAKRLAMKILNCWHIPEYVQKQIVEQVCYKAMKMALKRINMPGFGVQVVASIDMIKYEECDYSQYEEALRNAEIESMEVDAYKPKPATKSSIEALERFVFDDVESSKDCTICMDEIEVGMQAIRMPCSHYYHQDCIINWLQNSHFCPLCRYQMPY
ncbi:zinc finger protein, putative [Ricinus communis]|uniref:RING-type E3 ubiquitin transferase n=1 Tax=Ricinus communis TaxID=3988 RepID=B9T8K2_RICCO|nr:zinc finger protein, putative [Ricinus communis]